MPVKSGTLSLPQATPAPVTQSGPTIVVQKVNIPGPPGKPGSSAYSITSATFIVPDGDNVTTATATVDDARWVAVGQPVYIAGAGIFMVADILDAFTFLVVNPDYTQNASPGTEISEGAKISPAGFSGGGGGSPTYNIDSFTISGTGVAALVEVGSTQAVIDWNAVFNFTPTAISVSCTGLPAQIVTPSGSSASGSFTGPFTSNVNATSITLVITATDHTGGTHTAVASMTYGAHIVWGSVSSPAMSGQALWDTLTASNSLLTSGGSATIPFTSGFGQIQVFARLAGFGTPTVTDVSGADVYETMLVGTSQIMDNGTLQTVSFYAVGSPGAVLTLKVS